METSTPTSKLFKDIISLESDFKYNLHLLKIKDEEIQRCIIENNSLRDCVKCNLAEIRNLYARVAALEAELRKNQIKCLSEEQTHEKIVNNLREDLEELKRKRQVENEEYEEEIKQKISELKENHSKNILQQRLVYEKKVLDLQEKIQGEIYSSEKSEKQLNSLVAENMQLRCKMREMESQYSSESAIYKTELKSQQTLNAELLSEITCLKNHISTRDRIVETLTTEKKKLENELRRAREQVATLISKNNEANVINNKMRNEILKCRDIQRRTMAHNEQISKEIDRLRNELFQVKERNAGLEASGLFCNIPAHDKCEDYVKQNNILRDIVKGMRREKLSNPNRDNELNETEKRVEQLEAIVKALKQTFIEDTETEDSI